MQPNSAASVLQAIAHECGCDVDDIEGCLERINNRAGLFHRPMVRMLMAEARVDVIRHWLKTPETHGVVERTRDYIRTMSAA